MMTAARLAKRLLLAIFVFPVCLLLALPVVVIASLKRGAFRSLFFASDARGDGRIIRDKRPSLTAELVCAYRAIETHLGIIHDPLAEEFLEWDSQFLAFTAAIYYLARNAKPTGAIEYLAARTLAFDEYLSNCDVSQIVILGAGFDSRAYRLAFRRSRDAVVYEVDAPSTQAAKRECVKTAAKRNPGVFRGDNKTMMIEGRVKYVTCDFSSPTENFLERLEKKGFDRTKPSAFLMEGVASYLTWPALRETLETVSKNCLPRETLFAFNVLNGDTVDSSTFAKFIRSIGEEWKYGMPSTSSAEEVFGPLGFEIVREISFGEAINRYLRPAAGEEGRRKARRVDGRLVFMRVSR